MSTCLEVSPRDYHTRLTLNRADIFHEDSWLSKSSLWELNESSLYRWRFAPKQFKGSKFADWGTILDCILTTPEELPEIVFEHDFDSFRTKDAQTAKKEAQEAGLTVMHKDELIEARKAAEKVLANRDARELIEGSKKQVVMLSKIRDVNFKGLADIVPNGPYLCDIKTTALFSPSGISKQIGNLGYHVQAAIYLKLWNNLNPDNPRKRFRHIWQDQKPPYEVVVTELPTTEITAGNEYAAYLLGKLVKAAKSKKWPNMFDDKVAMIGRPQFQMFAEEAAMGDVFSAPNGKESA